ncbi:hypothetical protein KAFR_0D02980 [Kazachstania africana CBS 2517]|uniref:RNA binding protein She2 domain-containing protein n=1 Tax=Kazachstania africana (strain ATCC 22294 / BCRC 22015 / CBS 2517 / CECT 1963 / NBRC 1671 / NRRL Y-8276) TaxID=1071382 RepID=H2AU96_KAZAF|nr:hypothetical protein KAFR_0D02980 [Kazachstania africana CBS 2517]CCF57946.1 hypothetical protein KAFR_0D02980 [Kazachstania africana CBS 2517]
MTRYEAGGQAEYEKLSMTREIVDALSQIIPLFSKYLSSYIHLLNKFISHLRRVASLRYERTTLIKYVKKLRYFNDMLLEYDISETLNYVSLSDGIKPIASHFSKILEALDLLNFYFTQSLQKEIISKTLNFELTLADSCILAIDDAYNHFVKYTQWMVESIGAGSQFLDLEVVRFALKCAEEDETDLTETDNIFLQEVIEVNDEREYEHVTKQWGNVLKEKMVTLETEYTSTATKWHENFGKGKN